MSLHLSLRFFVTLCLITGLKPFVLQWDPWSVVSRLESPSPGQEILEYSLEEPRLNIGIRRLVLFPWTFSFDQDETSTRSDLSSLKPELIVRGPFDDLRELVPSYYNFCHKTLPCNLPSGVSTLFPLFTSSEWRVRPQLSSRVGSYHLCTYFRDLSWSSIQFPPFSTKSLNKPMSLISFLISFIKVKSSDQRTLLILSNLSHFLNFFSITSD